MATSGRRGERGVIFIALLVGLFVLAVMMMAAVQPATIVAKREKEKELIFRGEEYTEAIRRWQTEHGGTFPTHLKDLLKPGGPKRIRYIRKLYRNPFDVEGKWGILAPGTTVVTTDQNGKTVYIPQGGVAQQGQGVPTTPPRGDARPPVPGQGGAVPGQQGRPNVLPFRLNGEEGQPILGVYAKVHGPAFQDYRGKTNYDEWFFSPLVIPAPQMPGKPGVPQGPPVPPGTTPPKTS